MSNSLLSAFGGGGFHHTITADYQLKASNGRVQSFANSVIGCKLYLPDATTLRLGQMFYLWLGSAASGGVTIRAFGGTTTLIGAVGNFVYMFHLAGQATAEGKWIEFHPQIYHIGRVG